MDVGDKNAEEKQKRALNPWWSNQATRERDRLAEIREFGLEELAGRQTGRTSK